MRVHLVDGTYELFRHYFAVPKARDELGREVGAVRAVLASVLTMIRGGATHIGVATDHVIESFRNELWTGYKTSEGVEPDLLSQFPILEDVLSAAGIKVWPMVEVEADDALASAAAIALKDPRVDQVIICTPDKDLAQCVQGSRVVQLIRRTGITLDETGVIAKFGVSPMSIPDYLALVGDSADGYPGLPGWGAKSTSAVLAKFSHIESIPVSARDWHINVLNSASLADTLARERELALLFRTLATLRNNIHLFDNVDSLHWTASQFLRNRSIARQSCYGERAKIQAKARTPLNRMRVEPISASWKRSEGMDFDQAAPDHRSQSQRRPRKRAGTLLCLPGVRSVGVSGI